MNFDKFTIRLYYLCKFSILTKFKDDKKSIVISSINYLNSNFYNIYIYIYIVRTQFESLAQKMYELRSKEPNTMNL